VKPAMEKAKKTHNQPNVWGNQPMRKVVGYLSTSKANGARDVVWCQAQALLASVITTLEDKPLKALKTAENVAKIVKMVAQWSPMQKVLKVILKIIKWIKDQVKKWIKALKKVQKSKVFKKTVGTMCKLGTKFQDTLGKIRTVCFMNDVMSDACKRQSYMNNIGNDLKNMANERKNREIAAAKKKCDAGGFGSKAKKLKSSIDKGKSMLEKLAKAVKFAKAARDKVQPIVDKLNKRHSICYLKLPSCSGGGCRSCGWRGCRCSLPRCHMKCHKRWSGSVMDIIKVITGTIGRLMGFVTRPINGIINRITDFIARQITSALERFVPKVEELVPPIKEIKSGLDRLIARLPDPMGPFAGFKAQFEKMTKRDNTKGSCAAPAPGKVSKPPQWTKKYAHNECGGHEKYQGRRTLADCKKRCERDSGCKYIDFANVWSKCYGHPRSSSSRCKCYLTGYNGRCPKSGGNYEAWQKPSSGSSGCKGKVQTFQHGGFNGKRVLFGKGNYDYGRMTRMGQRNDDMSSLKVPSGCKVIAYQHGSFNGKAVTFGPGNYDYGRMTRMGQRNDDMSSLKVTNALIEMSSFQVVDHFE
jgi:hypothetical protein